MVICLLGGLVGFARIGGVELVIAIIVVGLAVGTLVGKKVIRSGHDRVRMPLRKVVVRRGFVLGLLFVLVLYLLVGVILLVFGTKLLPLIGAASTLLGLLCWVTLGGYYLVNKRRRGG